MTPVTPTLIQTRIARLGKGLLAIQEFEAAIREHAGWPVVSGPPGLPSPIIKVVSRLLRVCALALEHLLRFLPIRPRTSYLSIGYVAPHYLIYKTFPYFCLPARSRIIWMYDAWEDQLGPIETAMRTHRINVAFISSKQAAHHLDRCGIPNFRAYWLPEAVTITNYFSKPINERHIEVLQMGRRWDQYHDAIEEFCRRTNLVYLYEGQPGANIFASYQEYLEGLASSKISICVPSAITHPARSGKISTMTWRYLQSMAAKCLVLGRLPDEMHELFDYMPIIEIDMNDPFGQLANLLENYGSYLSLIERNYRYVHEHHQWVNRIEAMKRCLGEFENGQG